MNYKLRTNKAFTLIELVVAVALLAMVLSFAGVIFKVGIESYRTSSANAEIMQKLRAITDQLNRDFKELRKDGYLILHYEVSPNRREYQNSIQRGNFQVDRIYYFSTGDFQSWFDSNIRSNIARVYFGHDSISLNPALPDDMPVSKWNLARDVKLLTPGISDPNADYDNVSYAVCKVDLVDSFEDPGLLLNAPVPIDTRSNPPINPQSLMCQNVGEIVIKWMDGANWSLGSKSWTPVTPEQDWPKALKFTLTLYDSKGILKEGRTFTHIVYIGD